MKLNEDSRRLLIDWNDGMPIETVKIVTAKETCVLGNHYHKEKTERFMLLAGQATYKLDDSRPETMIINKPVIIKPNVKHEFILTEGSLMICLVDRLYDAKDDYV